MGPLTWVLKISKKWCGWQWYMSLDSGSMLFWGNLHTFDLHDMQIISDFITNRVLKSYIHTTDYRAILTSGPNSGWQPLKECVSSLNCFYLVGTTLLAVTAIRPYNPHISILTAISAMKKRSFNAMPWPCCSGLTMTNPPVDKRKICQWNSREKMTCILRILAKTKKTAKINNFKIILFNNFVNRSSFKNLYDPFLTNGR